MLRMDASNNESSLQLGLADSQSDDLSVEQSR
jgi:hypothetical protein